jgi:mRNA-degrading endonuclease RelE of RelBE toxin-antitoxin system
MTTRAPGDEAREEQARIFRDLAERLERGEPPMSADLIAPLVDELELRIDERAVDEAWTEEEEGSDSRHEPATRSRGVPVQRAIALLKRAERDLMALDPSERAALSRGIQALATEPLPRTARALHGRAERHMQQRMGKYRLLYSVREEVILLVAITAGPRT